jgi:ATP-dependent RNA helicase SUPV3L1/SUV3
VVGRLEGFRFAADASAGGSEAKALHAVAQKALAGEIESRATRLGQAPDEQFVLASDNHIRWTGDVVAVLIAGEETLRPRVRILADDQLTGAARDAVQARLDLWISAHVQKLLGPLIELSKAEDVTGIARGVAFQLVEALGVLERQKVAEEVKGLDQTARATLRKYAVRFGAYHIYIPALLKPAPRGLALQLHALKETGDLAGLDDVRTLAASGRTSIAANKSIAKVLYRSAGYRLCGERAVRVDILERLADLIRPALAWRENAPGVKPDGALDGRGFTVTVGMTSLVGSSGEDFASILRSLGYRMERRPKPQATEAAIAAAPPEQAAAASNEAPVSPDAPAEDAPVADAPPVSPGADLPSEEVAAAMGIAVEPASAAVAPEATETAAPSEQPAAAPGEAAAEQTIEVWRPGRFENRDRHKRRPHRGAQPAKPANAAAPAQSADAATAAGQAAAAETDKSAQPEQRHRHRPPRGDRHGPRKPHHGKPQHGKRPRPEETRERRERPERQPDPNSPFAKLAALKAQLESNAKERQ